MRLGTLRSSSKANYANSIQSLRERRREGTPGPHEFITVVQDAPLRQATTSKLSCSSHIQDSHQTPSSLNTAKFRSRTASPSMHSMRSSDYSSPLTVRQRIAYSEQSSSSSTRISEKSMPLSLQSKRQMGHQSNPSTLKQRRPASGHSVWWTRRRSTLH